MDAPRYRPAPVAYWTPGELARFLAATVDDPDAALWRVLALGGLRIGEAQALRWEDVDIDRGEVAIRRTMTVGEDGREMIGDAPKTDGSRRTVALLADAVASLRRHRVRQLETRVALGPRWTDAGLVFQRPDGRPINRTTAASRLKTACRTAGVPVISPHKLRHTHGTIASAAGVPVRALMSRLGHTTAGMAMRYQHLVDDSGRRAVEAIERELASAAEAERGQKRDFFAGDAEISQH